MAGVPQQDVRLDACVGQVGKCIGIDLNYADDAAASGLPVPPESVDFNKWTSALCVPDDAVQIPRGSVKTDWEVEFAVVISQGGCYITEADAMHHVAGYCVMNDVSERDYRLNRSGTWDKGKGCDCFGSLDPWLVTADEVPDPQNLALWLEVNGKCQQKDSTATMVYQVSFLISYSIFRSITTLGAKPQTVQACGKAKQQHVGLIWKWNYLSHFMSLQPGDVISIGKPPGVGMGQKPLVFLRAGQTMRLSVQGLGVQNQVTVSA